MHHLSLRGRRSSQALGRKAALILTALLAVACADDPLPTATEQVAEEAQRPSAFTRDADIRRDDSHFTARVRVSRVERGTSLRDASIVTPTVPDPPLDETLYIEGGYGAAGEMRFGVYWDALPATSPFSGIRAVGDRVEMLNLAGQVVSSKLFDAQMTEAGLPGGTLIGAYFPSGEPGLRTCPPGDLTCGRGASLREDASARTPAADSTPVGGVKELRRTLRAARNGRTTAGADDRTETVKRFRRVAKNSWRLEEVRQTEFVSTPRGPRETELVTRVTYGAWNRNAARDAIRAAAPAPIPEPRAVPQPRHALERQELPTDETRTAQQDILDGLCARGTTQSTVVRSKSIRGLSIVYQHGFCADATVWDGFRPRISSAFNVARESAFSLASTARAESQVDELGARMSEMGVRPNLVIGHSLGGLIARRLGQRDPAQVSAVITIGTPNTGARLAAIGPEAASELIEGNTSRLCVGDWLCQALARLLAERHSGQLLFGTSGFLPPVVQDLVPNSPFLNTLNSTSESFPRAGIEVDAGNRWAVFRMLGDTRSPRTRVVGGHRPDGQDWVNRAEGVYRSAKLLQFLSLFAFWNISTSGGGIDCMQSGYAAYWTPCVDTDWQGNWDSPSWMRDAITFLIYQISSFVITAMNVVDHTWDWLTTGTTDRTDGLIAASSQRYPNVPGTQPPVRVLITPPDGDSHSGETASPRVVDRTIDLIRTLGLAGL